MKYRQNGEAYPKYGGKISNVVCDAGANRHRREHPLPMSADDKQRYTKTLLYSLLSTEETISRQMAYPGKNPLSGYVFLIAENLEQLSENLRKVTGMTRLLGTGDEIIPLSQEEVDLLLKLGKEEQLVAMSTGIIENDQVRILTGPLQGMEGYIRKINRHKRKAWVSIEMFGRSVDMEVGLEIIKKV